MGSSLPRGGTFYEFFLTFLVLFVDFYITNIFSPNLTWNNVNLQGAKVNSKCEKLSLGISYSWPIDLQLSSSHSLAPGAPERISTWSGLSQKTILSLFLSQILVRTSAHVPMYVSKLGQDQSSCPYMFRRPWVYIMPWQIITKLVYLGVSDINWEDSIS